jgi:hypothetical protein
MGYSFGLSMIEGGKSKGTFLICYCLIKRDRGSFLVRVKKVLLGSLSC